MGRKPSYEIVGAMTEIERQIEKLATAYVKMRNPEEEKDASDEAASSAFSLLGIFLLNQQRIADALHVIAAAADARK